MHEFTHTSSFIDATRVHLFSVGNLATNVVPTSIHFLLDDVDVNDLVLMA